MIDKTMRPLILLIAAMALLPSQVWGAEPLPPRALARLGDHRFYHGPGIECAALSPDGRRIASAANYSDGDSDYVADKDQEEYNRVLVLWDAVSGERLRELHIPNNSYSISCLAFSADSKSLAAAYARSENAFEVAVFAVETGKLQRCLKHFTNEIGYLQCSHDGKQWHVSEERGPVSAWDADTGKQLRLWKPPTEEAAVGEENQRRGLCGLLSPDGKIIAWEMGYRDEAKGANAWRVTCLRVHDAATDKLLYRKNVPPEQSWSGLVFSADGKRMAADWGNQLLIWDTATGKERGNIADTSSFGFALTSDGRRAVVYPDVWDVESGKRVRRISLGFVDFGRYYPASARQAISDDDKTLLLAISPTPRLFDTATGKERFPANHFSPVTPRFSADGRTLFTSCGIRRCRWDVSGTKPILLSHGQRKAWDYGWVYSADDRLLLDAVEGSLRLRETATGRVLRTFEGDSYRSYDLPFALFSPDAAKALFAKNHDGRKNLRIYDVKTAKMTGVIQPVDDSGDPVFSPNGRQVAWADGDDSVHLYNAVTGKAVRTLRSSKPLPQREGTSHARLLFAPDGERLIAASHDVHIPGDGYLQRPTRVFQVCSGREILRFYANPKTTNKAAELTCMVCSPDGRLLAVAEKFSGMVRLIELASGQVRVEFAGHRHGVHGLAFAPDGQTLASGGKDHYVFLWDVTGAKSPTAANKTSDDDLSPLWNDLASEDAKRAGGAIASFLRKPESSVAFLQEKLHPAEALDAKRLAQWIADLDSDVFETREAASQELIRLGERAETSLQRALKSRPSLEMRRRIEDVLSKLEPSPLPPETLRTLRAIEVLEHIGAPAARRCLEALAKGAADARQTREAQAALRRLTKRRE